MLRTKKNESMLDDRRSKDDDEEDTRARRGGKTSANDFSAENEGFLVKYRGKSYEISDLIKKHPGGRNTLGAVKGLTLDKVLSEVPHSDAAFHLLQDFLVDNRREYDDIENLVNWNEPMFGQVANLNDRYWEWVNLPVNRSIRLFKSDFLENLTITPWYLVPIVWVPISIYFLYLGFIANKSSYYLYSIPEIALAVFSGILLWTFMEYTIHRNLFHFKPSSNSRILISLHFILHGVHHKAPFDSQRLVFPPGAAILAATILFLLFRAVVPDVVIYFITFGAMTGYLCYDLMHYYLHHGSPRADSYLYVMKRYHNHHHFSHHNEGFGITSRLWDVLFGTMIRLKQLQKALVW